MSISKTDSIMNEYFEKHYDDHQKLIERHSTPEGRMAMAYEQSDGTAADAFYRFLESEMSCSHAAKCLIYMPDFGIRRESDPRHNRKGKVVIEVDSRQSSTQLGEDCFELQLSRKTDLSGVKLKYYYYKNRDKYPTSEFAGRYYNMFLSWDDAIPLVQRVLFSSLFRQRLFMTTESRVLGSITTQRFMSSEIGQLLSLRACLLNEYR